RSGRQCSSGDLHVSLRGGADASRRGVGHQPVAAQAHEEHEKREQRQQRRRGGDQRIGQGVQLENAVFRSTSAFWSAWKCSNCAAGKSPRRAISASGSASMRTLLVLTASL